MGPGDKRSTFTDILYQRCPRCRSGSIFRTSIFRGFPRMNERCPVCNLKFEREQGYFLGAMYISYGLALGIITLFTAGLWAATGRWITSATIWGVIGLGFGAVAERLLAARDAPRAARVPASA